MIKKLSNTTIDILFELKDLLQLFLEVAMCVVVYSVIILIAYALVKNVFNTVNSFTRKYMLQHEVTYDADISVEITEPTSVTVENNYGAIIIN